ncbi:hypothetical protein NK718_01770 [Alsobacter sp. SYSU M60028]|uniref:HPt domain-containing protein n=1 Tax=Alsobacter ponti TaxID=2962936 RepID=A0ABT1L719_9HYPH|nr:hypothetical protein [Alsobacter ponti]MCP8937230.1 hypothetical protein [Alsobacter ponti]
MRPDPCSESARPPEAEALPVAALRSAYGAMLPALVARFAGEMEGRLAALERALERGGSRRVRRAALSLVGPLACLGALDAARLAEACAGAPAATARSTGCVALAEARRAVAAALRYAQENCQADD